MAADKIKLITEITEAFKDTKLEDGIGLSEADAIDNYEDEKSRAECKKKMKKITEMLFLHQHLINITAA